MNPLDRTDLINLNKLPDRKASASKSKNALITFLATHKINNSILHEACQNKKLFKDPTYLKNLIKLNPELLICENGWQQLPLHLLSSDIPDKALYMVQKYPGTLLAKDFNGRTPLKCMLQYYSRKSVEKIFSDQHQQHLKRKLLLNNSTSLPSDLVNTIEDYHHPLKSIIYDRDNLGQNFLDLVKHMGVKRVLKVIKAYPPKTDDPSYQTFLSAMKLLKLKTPPKRRRRKISQAQKSQNILAFRSDFRALS